MNLDHVPHPEIENHPHIRELIEAQEKRAYDREYHRSRIKEQEDRQSTLTDSKAVTITDFWCDRCSKDFKAQAVRQIETDWSNTKQNIAFYKTKCWNGHWCIRLISDKHKDGFWAKSRLMAKDRGNHFADTVQPYETNYQLLYGKLK